MTNFLSVIAQSQSRLVDICRACHVRRLYLFGSALTTEFDRDHVSDLDFFVEMNDLPPLDRGENLLQLWNDLEALFGRPVDLLSHSAVQNPFLRKQIDATKELVYDGASQEIPG